MNYWHMQLHPGEFDDWSIEDIKAILNLKIIGCSGEPVARLKQISEDDVVLIRHGGHVIALVKIISKTFFIPPEERTEIKWFSDAMHIQILEFYNNKKISGEGWYLPKTIMPVENEIAYNYINDLFLKHNAKFIMKNNIQILKYKKQIILQGPPGTGKTRMALEIAKEMISKSLILEEIDNKFIREKIKPDVILKTPDGYEFKVESIVGETINIITSTNVKYPVSFDLILQTLKEPAQKNLPRSYAKGLLIYLKNELKKEQYKIIQFHPSYSYEDFVRGITAKTNGTNIEYITENRILADFAKKASENLNSINDAELITKSILAFRQFISDKLNINGQVLLTENVFISQIDQQKFYYFGHDNEVSTPISFDELRCMIENNPQTNGDLVNLQCISGVGRNRPTYHFKLYQIYQNFIAENPENKSKPFVLIVDEINRANLPSVLGELIYALEYRGESVDSMYELKLEGRKITLPPNLYIIGTMNTADRSVGHIDYAIRRRFAFVDVLPTKEVINQVVPEKDDLRNKANRLFDKVADLFTIKYLSSDFKAEQVQLGHSYFLCNKLEELDLKLQYEIKPLLKEYLKDGIFKNMESDGKNEIEDIINQLNYND